VLKALLTAGALGAGPGSVAATTSAAPAARKSLLRSLLDRNHGLHPEFSHGLSNHLSMGLFSLAALGASPGRLQALAESQWPRLEPWPKAMGPQITDTNWTTFLGRREALPGFRSLFSQQIAATGVSGTLRRYLPDLLPGIGAGAFHALIRTGYGVRFRDDHEVADGLAYWAVAFLPLGPLLPTQGERDPARILEKVHTSPSLGGLSPSGRLIFDRMTAASAAAGFQAAVAALRPEAKTLDLLASTAVKLYVATGDFTALHMVTGAHAYRLLAPHIPAGPEPTRYFWQALVAAYITIGAPRIVDGGPGKEAVPPWKAISSKTVASLDEHDIKLVEVAREEEAFYGSPLYRRAAARRMKLI
jgi:hypothetical protein